MGKRGGGNTNFYSANSGDSLQARDSLSVDAIFEKYPVPGNNAITNYDNYKNLQIRPVGKARGSSSGPQKIKQYSPRKKVIGFFESGKDLVEDCFPSRCAIKL